jgi:hypothetical protein
MIELIVGEWCRHDVFHGRARRARGNQTAHEQPRDRGVAVREVVDIGFFRACRQRLALRAQARQVQGFARRHGIDSDRPQIVGAGLQILEDVVVGLPILAQEIPIADVLEDVEPLRARKAGQHVPLGHAHGVELHARPLAQRHGRDMRAQRGVIAALIAPIVPGAEGPSHEPIDAEHLALEEGRMVELPSIIESLIEIRFETRQVDAEIGEQSAGHRAVFGFRRVDRLGAAIADDRPAVDTEFVALRMPTEIVVRIEDQNPRRGPVAAVKICGRQAADAGPDDDQVVVFGHARAAQIERSPVAQAVGGLERPDVAAAQPRPGRRIIRCRRRLCRRRVRCLGCRRLALRSRHVDTRDAGHGNGDAVHEISACDHPRTLPDRSERPPLHAHQAFGTMRHGKEMDPACSRVHRARRWRSWILLLVP